MVAVFDERIRHGFFLFAIFCVIYVGAGIVSGFLIMLLMDSEHHIKTNHTF